jgi:hypothetical protein
MVSFRQRTLYVVLGGAISASALLSAQSPSNKPIARFTATTAGVASPGQTVTITLFGWSDDSERDRLVKAWDIPVPAADRAANAAPATDGAAGAAPAAGRAGRGAVAAGRGAAAGGRGAAAGGRGAAAGGRGAPVTSANPPLTPSRSLAEALQTAPTMGLLWDSEAAGYAIRYAYRLPQSDGGERIILITDRRLSPVSSLWKPVAPAPKPTDYTFSVIELRLNSQGVGDGKAALDTPIAIDSGAKFIALENYDSLPIVFTKVRRLKN